PKAMKATSIRHLIAMGHVVKDTCARTFCDIFFRTIVGKGKTVETAVLRARSKILDQSVASDETNLEKASWIGVPVLYTSVLAGQNPFSCPEGEPKIVDSSPVCHLHNINKSFKVVRGRNQEIFEFVDTVLNNDRERIHSIVGGPGIGKTTFA